MILAVLLWTVAAGKVDIDGDGVIDRIRIESRDAVRYQDPEPCGSCGDHIDGHFEAVVELSSKRIVRTPVFIHNSDEELWFWNKPTSHLAISDYNGDGRPDFNLGQYTNTTKWEYALFTIQPDGHVEPLSLHEPEIYVSPGGEPSTERIEAIPGGFRFRDFGNAGESPGWWTFTCQWQKERRTFRCSGEPDHP